MKERSGASLLVSEKQNAPSSVKRKGNGNSVYDKRCVNISFRASVLNEDGEAECIFRFGEMTIVAGKNNREPSVLFYSFSLDFTIVCSYL